ncbi:UDP-N-acetylglucosamine 1-carboxyvinyltransferase1 [Striga asiatica]|uniref:UDP-N-acetylglucosamine 1-carboxyvinyltransferase1 n=1 Tax=Striga asiatica TaxID=4170 RepID=A0A5A7QI10_STRAF|nr:UDP-N-acetylglucosamine 1-carboxyvinyltransferase1 [Striga asiatica]
MYGATFNIGKVDLPMTKNEISVYKILRSNILKQRSLSSKLTIELKFSATCRQCFSVRSDFAKSPPITVIDKGRPLQFSAIFLPEASSSRGQSSSPNTILQRRFQLLSSSRKSISRPREPLMSEAKFDSLVVNNIALPSLLSGK